MQFRQPPVEKVDHQVKVDLAKAHLEIDSLKQENYDMRQENVDLADEIEKLRDELKSLKQNKGDNTSRSSSRIGQGVLSKRKQLINLRPTSFIHDDNEEFQNIENQIKQSIGQIANIGNGLKEAGGLTALKKSSRHRLESNTNLTESIA